MNTNQVMAVSNSAGGQTKGANRTSAKGRGAFASSAGSRNRTFNNVLAKSQEQGVATAPQEMEQAAKDMEALAKETAVLEKFPKAMKKEAGDPATEDQGTTAGDGQSAKDEALLPEDRCENPDEIVTSTAATPGISAVMEVPFVLPSAGIIQNVSSSYANLQSLLPQSEEQGTKREQMLAMLSGQVVKGGQGEQKAGFFAEQQVGTPAARNVSVPLSTQLPQAARNLVMNANVIEQPSTDALPMDISSRQEVQGKTPFMQFAATNAVRIDSPVATSGNSQVYLQATQSAALHQAMADQQSQQNDFLAGVQVLVEDSGVSAAQDLLQKSMDQGSQFQQGTQSSEQQTAGLREPEEVPFGQQVMPDGDEEGLSVRQQVVSRGNTEELSGQQVVSRGNTEELSGQQAVSRGDTEELSGQQAVSRGNTEELSGQQVVSRGNTEELSGQQAVSRGKAEERSGQQVMPRGNAKELSGQQVISLGRENGTAGQQMPQIQAEASGALFEQQPSTLRGAENMRPAWQQGMLPGAESLLSAQRMGMSPGLEVQPFETSQDEGAAPKQNMEGGQIPVGYQPPVQEAGNASSQIQSQAVGQMREDFDIPQQIVEQARLIRARESTEMVIHLKPEHLGNLTLRVSVAENGAVTASFYSDNAHVRSIVENSLAQLRQDLENQGIKVDRAEVYAGLSDGQLPQGQGQQAWQQNQGQGNPAQELRNLRADIDSFAETSAEVAAAVQEDTGISDKGVDYRV